MNEIKTTLMFVIAVAVVVIVLELREIASILAV